MVHQAPGKEEARQRAPPGQAAVRRKKRSTVATEVGAPIHAADIGAQVGQVTQGPGPSKLSVKSLGGFRRGQGRR